MRKHFHKTQATFTVELDNWHRGASRSKFHPDWRGLARRETLLSEPRVPEREARPPLCAAGDVSGSCGP